MYLSVFYCLCYVKYLYTDMLEDRVSEERYQELNEEEDIIMEYIRQEHCMYVTDDGKYKHRIHDLSWYLYTKPN